MDQKVAFQERLQRINSGKHFEAPDVIGHHTQKAYIRKNGKRLKRPRRTFAQKLMVVVAFVSGVLAVVLGRMAYFHLSQVDGMPEAFVNLQGRGMFLSVLVVAGLMIVLLGLSTKGRMQALMLGAVAMHFGEAAAAATMPSLWAEMFSPDYTAALVEAAPNIAALAVAG